jgi:hypothetical protein
MKTARAVALIRAVKAVRILLFLGLVLFVITGPNALVWAEESAGGQAGTEPTAEPASSEAEFKDLTPDHWAYAAIAQGVRQGYIAGFPDGTFRPNDPVTVAQFIKMTLMSLTDDSSGFVWWSDKYLALVPDWYQFFLNNATANFEDGTPWYENYVRTAQNLELIADEYVGRYDEPLTRERAAKIVNNLDDYFHGSFQREHALLAGTQLFKDFDRADFYFQEYVGDVALRGIMVGNEAGYFNPKATITRAEAAKICLLLADANLRSHVSVDLTGVPYSIVPSPGYGPYILIFANDEMKRTYDAMYEAQKDYPGATMADTGLLDYFADEELKEKAFKKRYYPDKSDSNFIGDFGISFSGNVYILTISTDQQNFQRGSNELTHFLSLIISNPTQRSSLFNEIKTSIINSQENKDVSINKIVDDRQVIIQGYGNYVYLAISAYQDKK